MTPNGKVAGLGSFALAQTGAMAKFKGPDRSDAMGL
jgi:hypothetical protein